jgi:hypothetical protein
MRGAFANLRNAAAEASKEAAASLRAGAKELAAASKEALKEAGSRTKALSEVVAAKVEVAAVAGAEKTRALAAVAADKTSALGDRAAKALAERASQASAAFSSKLDHSGHHGACTPTVCAVEQTQLRGLVQLPFPKRKHSRALVQPPVPLYLCAPQTATTRTWLHSDARVEQR